MTIHIAVLILTLLNGVFILSNRSWSDRWAVKCYIVLSELLLFLAIGLRGYTVGLDTRVYRAFFNRLANDPSLARRVGWEPLFLLIIRIGMFFRSFQLVLIICAAVTCIGFGVFVYNNSKTRWTSFWFFFFYITLNLYFNSMHLIRQICAMAIAINIYTILSKEKNRVAYIKSVILVLLACGFHITAAIFIIPIIMAVVLKKINRKTILLAGLAALVGSLFLTVGQSFLLSLISRFGRYENDERLAQGNIGVYAVAMILIKVIMTVMVLWLDPQRKENRELYQLTFINVIATMFFCLQTRTQFALRIGYWYEMFFPLYVPLFVSKFRIKSTRQVLYALFFIFGVVYFFYMMRFGGVKSNRGTVPYVFYWQV